MQQLIKSHQRDSVKIKPNNSDISRPLAILMLSHILF